MTLQLGKALFKRRATETLLRKSLAIQLLGAGAITNEFMLWKSSLGVES